MESTKVEHTRSRRTNITVEETEDEDIQRMNVKDKLDTSLSYLIDDGKDQGESNRFAQGNTPTPQVRGENKKPTSYNTYEVPVNTGKQFTRKTLTTDTNDSVLTLHSVHSQHIPLSQKEEVLLAAMDANLNALMKDEEQLPDLRKNWVESAKDILSGVPNHLPPLQEVNHKIPIIDEEKQYSYYLPRCPDALKKQLIDKIQDYKSAGWWEETNVSQAAPMLCILKKGRAKLCTVIDGRKQNENTKKDVTPFPDQEQIRNDVARGKYQLKINMSNVYEQIRVELSDVWKTAFATIYGTFVSHTMLQGDCNAPATFQWLMTIIFQEYIGRFVHVYLDDIFVFSNSIEEHKKHLGLVFDKLRKAQLFLEERKLNLYSKKMDCLGHIIDDRGIHVDSDKMA